MLVTWGCSLPTVQMCWHGLPQGTQPVRHQLSQELTGSV